MVKLSSTTPASRTATRVLTSFLAVLFCAGLVLTALATLEALEERRSAVAVTDLRLAVIGALDVDADMSPTFIEQERLGSSIAVLSLPRGDAMHVVDADRQEFVEEELDKILTHARQLASGEMVMAEMHNAVVHSELEQVLRKASLDAATSASTSEGRAAIAGVSSIGVLILLGLTFLRRRSERDRRQAHDVAFQAAALRFGALLDESADAICIRDTAGGFSYRSAKFDGLFDPNHVKDADDLIMLLDSDQREELDRSLATTDADVCLDVRLAATAELPSREFSVRVSDLSADPVVAGHLISLRETTADNQSRRELEALVVTDPLTGLPNRRALMQRLGAPMTAVCSLLMIDLDEFKRTNDTHGHAAGDELLRSVADRFRGVVTDKEQLFRLGGDEFAVLAERDDQHELRVLGQKLLSAFEQPVALASGLEEVNLSIGIATCNGRSSRLALLRRADIALYAAKSDGGNRYQMLRPELEERSIRQREISLRLNSVVLDDEFHLVFQPIVDSATGSVSFVEALVRWTNPELGMIYPDEFIPMAESSGRIVEIGLWVLDHALEQFSRWPLDASEHRALTVNVSPRQLEEDAFVQATLALLRKHNVDAGDLVLEVTESALVEPGTGMVERLEQLREAGCLVACDDFGSGYSNLGQLMTLPLDLIKVDRQLLLQLSAMRDMAADNSQVCQVMGAIATIGAAMNAPIVAEGVETEVQRRSLQASGVEYLQGYHFSRPVDPVVILEMLSGSRRSVATAAMA